jgi:hypothetical protein
LVNNVYIKYYWLKCTFGPPSFQKLRFLPPYFENSTLCPPSFIPFAKPWHPLILIRSKLTCHVIFLAMLDIIKIKILPTLIITIKIKTIKGEISHVALHSRLETVQTKIQLGIRVKSKLQIPLSFQSTYVA